jgi:hypothetical protein
MVNLLAHFYVVVVDVAVVEGVAWLDDEHATYHQFLYGDCAEVFE